MIRTLFIFVLLTALAFAQDPADHGAGEWALVEKVLGRAGALDAGVYKVTFPRTDLRVRVGRTAVRPAAALTSWMAFSKDPSGIVATGDLVLLPSEMNAAIGALQERGMEITAIHNHLAGEKPHVMYVHFFARGDLAGIVEGLKAALAATRTPSAPAAPSGTPVAQKTIEATLGKPGAAAGDVLSFAFPRDHRILMHGATMAPAMGMSTVINFQPSASGVAATGDFVLREREVNSVVSKLRQRGLQVTAVHNHMLDDEPRMVFVHFWGEGKPDEIAKALRETLEVAH